MYGWVVLWLFLIIIGTFFRGPNWNFFGPFEYWDTHKVEALTNVNLSEILWVKWLNQGLPSNILVRESLGFIVTGLYLFVLPVILAIFGFWKIDYLERERPSEQTLVVSAMHILFLGSL